ncbi:MAG TPA: anaerobic carbon-monoxide dehydrogenase catalytic subunit [Oscillospiraceae bacterium]|nr:anaerobic carbon-monoxide dehydrogenase catalytic subunit [Oscillospiraceae bacterium]HPS34787.1 anaerobic carbon-monoxide dehydrogenase catalytic subunit [Oscillospiraceae bacterium]
MQTLATDFENFQNKVSDGASLDMLVKAQIECVETCFDRMELQKNQCSFGKSGVCCRNCHMGPCRITPKAPKGVCGADVDTIVARNFLRSVAGGTATHSDHGRHLVLRLKKVAQGQGNGYAIKDAKALWYAADLYKINREGRTKEEVALDLANLLLGEFSSQEETLKTLDLAPVKRQGVWKAKDVMPLGIDRMVVEALHRTTMGVDHDYKHLLMHAFRTALADGWGGSRAASIVSDILFGTPAPVKSRANLGVLKEDTVNIIIHGHEPELSEMLTVAVQDPEVLEYAKSRGVQGVTLAGICCTANEILMRHGVPVAGNLLQQELAIVTGAVEMMIIDVQCCMPSLPEVAKSYHTEIVSTTPIAKTVGATQLDLNEEFPLKSAKELVMRAIDNYKNRDSKKVSIPKQSEPMVAGFSVNAIKYMLGGKYRASFRPLNDAIIANRITGIVGIVGCNNPKSKMDEYTNILTKELIARNVLVLKTGCAAIASGKAGMLKPEIGLEMAGKGLREICETVGIPPILHMGSCVDNSRILEAATEVVLEGGLGDDLSMVPAVGVAPEWMSEKAIAIGSYFVASGVDVVLGSGFNVSGSENVTKFLNEETADLFGASFHVCEDPMTAVELIMKLLNEKRDKLGINKKAERKLYDMKDRRGMDV